MSSRSALSDTDVLKRTIKSTPDNKGRVQLECTLPDGYTIRSTDWLVPDEIKGKVLIAWANAVREQDALRIQEREQQSQLAKASRTSAEQGAAAQPGTPSRVRTEGGAPAPAGKTEQSSTSSGGLPDDPTDLIKVKVSHLMVMKANLLLQEKEIRHQLKEVEANLERWQKVAGGLGLDLSEKEQKDEAGTGEDGADHSGGDGDGSTDGGAGPTPSKRRRSKRKARASGSGDSSAAGDAGGSPEA